MGNNYCCYKSCNKIVNNVNGCNCKVYDGNNWREFALCREHRDTILNFMKDSTDKKKDIKESRKSDNSIKDTDLTVIEEDSNTDNDQSLSVSASDTYLGTLNNLKQAKKAAREKDKQEAIDKINSLTEEELNNIDELFEIFPNIRKSSVSHIYEVGVKNILLGYVEGATINDLSAKFHMSTAHLRAIVNMYGFLRSSGHDRTMHGKREYVKKDTDSTGTNSTSTINDIKTESGVITGNVITDRKKGVKLRRELQREDPLHSWNKDADDEL